MAGMIGFMATWTTYGTWLQGDKRGYVKNGITLGANAHLEKSNEELLKHDKIKIPKSLRKTVENAILKEAEEINPRLRIFITSAVSGAGMEELAEYLIEHLRRLRKSHA